MHIINLTPLEDGVYNDHNSDGIISPPEGWAYIPHEGEPIPIEWQDKEVDYTLPSTFPRLGSLEAEELTYVYEVEVEKEVIKTREVETVDDEGSPITVTEEYTETEIVTEQRTRKMMTVTKMTEGTLPEPQPEPEPQPTLDERVTEVEANVEDINAAMTALLTGEGMI